MFRPQYFDRINRINRIRKKGYKYPENHVNPVKITRKRGRTSDYKFICQTKLV